MLDRWAEIEGVFQLGGMGTYGFLRYKTEFLHLAQQDKREHFDNFDRCS